MKHPFTRLSLILLLALLIGSRVADADSPIKLVAQDQKYSFAQRMRFTGEFSSQSSITKITLLFATQGDWRIFSTELPIPQGQSTIKVSYTLDLQEHPIYSFSQVEYWWLVESAGGATLETKPVSFIYVDNRYDWYDTAQENIHVYWAADDPTLGHMALRIAQDGLERIQTILPPPLDQEIAIYIYPSPAELSSAMRLTDQSWAGGLANPELGVILVSAREGPEAAIDLQHSIPHEVAHFAVEHSAGSQINQIPFWLHEGLATNNEAQPNSTFAIALEKAVKEDSLFSLETLCSPPLADQSSALLFYAESASIVRYLQNLYGNQSIRQLLAAYGDGADCNGGVERILNMTLAELGAEWMSSLEAKTELVEQPDLDLDDMVLWAGLLGGSAALASAFYLFRPRDQDRA